MAHPTWALGLGDAVWGSRLVQPNPHAWTAIDAKHKGQELTLPLEEPEPKALACYGLVVRPEPHQRDQLWRRLVTGRPVRAGTMELLAWCAAPLVAQGCTALLVLWDHAS